MKLSKALLVFVTGLVFGAIIATFIAYHSDLSWSTGPIMVAFSLPVSAAYFLGLWALARWHSSFLNSPGLAFAGSACAIYPTFCGLFPVYNLRFGLMIPIIVAQFGFIVLTSLVFSWIHKGDDKLTLPD
jgi:hypothetical protein